MKKVFLFIPVMKGGGAERVAALLMNEFSSNGLETRIVLTSSKESEAVTSDLGENVELCSLKESNSKTGVFYKALRLFSSVICVFFEKLGLRVPSFFAYLSFVSQYHDKIKQINEMLRENPEATAIAFLQPAIPMLMLAARGLQNRVIISERGNPEKILNKRFGLNFMTKYYGRCDRVVFQTGSAMAAYPDKISEKGLVIPNPLKPGLPEPYCGEREKRIVSFCRISPEKRLDVLIDAFKLFSEKHPLYTLKIIGDATNENCLRLLEELKVKVNNLGISEKVSFLPFSGEVHSQVKTAAMYINSSETEGLSNAMLESLAIGLPTICTDCPIGGARLTIKNGENGLLIPVNDVEAMCEAMSKIADDDKFSAAISIGGAKIREELSLDRIGKKWLEII